jgi:hypothetical protein
LVFRAILKVNKIVKGKWNASCVKDWLNHCMGSS